MMDFVGTLDRLYINVLFVLEERKENMGKNVFSIEICANMSLNYI